MSLPASEQVGQQCYRVFFDRNEPCEHCTAKRTLNKKETHRWSTSWSGPDHRNQEWDVSAYPIPGSQEGSARAVIVWQDRTEERRLENSLMQAGKLAAIGQLAAGVAHEINNPLTVINANAEMLQMSIEPTDDNYESVELIAQAGQRAANVVRGLLDFARQTEYAFEAANVNDSIRRALSLVTYQFNATNIDIVATLEKDLPGVEGSWEHLQSVWLNLLLNARDAIQEKSGERRFEIITRYEPGEKEVLVVVHDTGRGMTPDELAHIFEPFYTTKAPGEGTGLGLATCHRIVEQHNGEINVTSTAGEGTTFVVRLPIHEDKVTIIS
jgi:two-component system NtrC family sensor kinase